MYIFTLVGDVYKVVEKLRVQFGDFKLAMLYNSALDVPSNWNLIVSSPVRGRATTAAPDTRRRSSESGHG